jgi:hypothetical protein
MNWGDVFNHLFNFAAPALALAVLLPLVAARFFRKKRGGALSWWLQIAINGVAGLAALVLSLWWLGSDGKVQTYATLVLVVTTSQWLLVRGWRS